MWMIYETQETYESDKKNVFFESLQGVHELRLFSICLFNAYLTVVSEHLPSFPVSNINNVSY